MNRKIRYREMLQLGLDDACFVWKINNVSGSQGSKPASQTTTGHAADLLHLLSVVTRTFGSEINDIATQIFHETICGCAPVRAPACFNTDRAINPSEQLSNGSLTSLSFGVLPLFLKKHAKRGKDVPSVQTDYCPAWRLCGQ